VRAPRRSAVEGGRGFGEQNDPGRLDEQRSRERAPSLVVIDGVTLGQHSVVEDAADKNIFALPAKEQNMPPFFDTPQARPNVLTAAASRRQVNETPTRGLEPVEIVRRLGLTPGANRVCNDGIKVGQSAVRKAKGRHKFLVRPRRP
jgi:hypothetical protein